MFNKKPEVIYSNIYCYLVSLDRAKIDDENYCRHVHESRLRRPIKSEACSDTIISFVRRYTNKLLQTIIY